MCVLGRPFGLRQMAKNGKNVVLMRDMTDTMYNPLKRPFVSHFTGTDLIVEHIEKWVCPTITSDQILGGKPFRFKQDTRPHVAVVIAEREYMTHESLPPFALNELGKEFRVSFVFANEKERNDLPGVDVLNDADVLLLSVRRRVLPPTQMSIVRKYLESGKPIVGIRTSNHAFLLRKQAAPEGFESWDTWDADIFGGHYTNHHGVGPDVAVTVAEGAAVHPILKGIDTKSITGKGSLYIVNPLAKSTTPLLIGAVPEKAAETIAWANQTKFGGKSFYTSLGHVDDFAQPEFRRLLANAVRWAASKE
jgi:type 1 glutamine amidotransferase